MAKTLGIVGGIGPESTVDYYRQVLAGFRERVTDGSDPHILIDSLNLKELRDLAEAGRFEEMGGHLVRSLHRLAVAGADFGVLSANTAHVVFDQVRAQSPIPLISIVEATRAEAKALALKRLGLLGTRFTMQEKFYPEVFAREGMAIVPPLGDEVAWIHQKYFDELVPGKFLPETRDRFVEIALRMRGRDRLDGLIFGGTELPLLLRGVDLGMPALDTTKIHVASIVAELVS
ncbi:MAG TPA: amino acid racemase [Terriglobales bacterium]|nr:amino acid racemase [Terriglobales bacterium]